MFTNQQDRVVRTSTLRCNFSPHNFIRALFHVKKEKPRQFVVNCLTTSNISWDALKLDLVLSDWDQVTAASSGSEIQSVHCTIHGGCQHSCSHEKGYYQEPHRTTAHRAHPAAAGTQEGGGAEW